MASRTLASTGAAREEVRRALAGKRSDVSGTVFKLDPAQRPW